MPLEFIEESHKYLLDGKELVSVTEVLPYNYTCSEFYRIRGKYVHKTIELYSKNDLDEDSLDPVLQGYLQAYKKFRVEYKDIKGIIDIKSGSPHPCNELQIKGYALLVNEGLLEDGTKHEYGVLFERPFYHPQYFYAGTPDIVIVDKLPVTQGHILYLREDGSYKLDPVKDIRKDKGIFLSFVITYQWKKERGLL